LGHSAARGEDLPQLRRERNTDADLN